jgi:TonB-dependent receptor
MPRPRHTALRIAMAALGWAGLAATCPAAAQDRTFNIPAEDAAAALPAFVQQSGRQVLADARELGGIRTNAVQGRMDADTALKRLLAGTGLVVKARGFSPGDVSIAVGRAPAPAPPGRTAGPVPVTAIAAAPADPTLVVVTSYRQSLQTAAETQRRAVNFTEAVYAEDVGKFPDLNLAEALQRVPGVQLTRDQITGEGIQVAIRALDPSFTNVLINGGRIEVASDGGLDGGSANRQTDLDLFPSELFNRIIVSKTPRAEQLEGGIAGTVDLAPVHPFDFRGHHVVLSAGEGYGQSSRQWSPHAAFIASNTWNHWGLLFGAAGETKRFETDGFESLGWSNANLGCPGCDNSAGNNFTFAAIVPSNAGNGLTPGATVDYAALNPSLTLNQLTNALVPRLGRNILVEGQRTRVTAMASLQYRPSEAARWTLDAMWGHLWRRYDRDDLDWYVRNSAPSTTGGMVPIGVEVDAHDVVTSGTFANSAFFDQSSLRIEKLDYKSLQSGLTWRLGSRWRLDADAGATRSTFRRDATSFLFDTPFDSGITVKLANDTGHAAPAIQTNADVNAPSLGWTLDRVNIQNMRRVTNTWGAHANLTWQPAPDTAVKAGLAWDRATRTIFAWDNSLAYQAAFANLVPPSAIAGFLHPNTDSHYLGLVDTSPGGVRNFVTADVPALMAASNYSFYDANAPVSTTATVQGTPAGSIDETYSGAYAQFNRRLDLMGRPLQLDAGVRAVRTRQTIWGPVSVNGRLSYPVAARTYGEVLPAANAVWRVTGTVDLRAAVSRTMSRPNPTSLLPGTSFTDPSAQNATRGNPDLKPYFSDNIDAGVNLRTGRAGYLSLALFRKRITGFTYATQVVEPFDRIGIDYNTLTVPQQQAIAANGGPAVAKVNVYTSVNADSRLTLNGLELTWVQPLDPVRPGLGLSINYTRLTTRYSGPTNLATGIAPRSYNLTAYYEHAAFSAHVSYVYEAARQTQNAPQNGLPVGLYALGRGQVDLSASWRMRGLGKITLDATNLTNAPYRMVFGTAGATYSVYNPGYQALIGWQGTF